MRCVSLHFFFLLLLFRPTAISVQAATILIRRKRTSRFDENKTTLDALTFVKAGDTAGVRQLTKLPVSAIMNIFLPSCFVWDLP